MKIDHAKIVKKFFKDRMKLTLFFVSVITFLIGYLWGVSTALNKCVEIGLKLISLDGVHLDFSDSMKAILKYYSGEWA